MEKLEIKLSSVLELLASNATEQIRYLEQIGGKGCVDELGLEFDDIFFVADEMFKQNKISKEYYDILCRLDSKLD
ncbi:MAG: hypothetical protein SV375_23415, partial [Thermodesulfobacteriota bacterium]|nr:hypothetical protein [Thermodesulfobacteriota bacterium]